MLDILRNRLSPDEQDLYDRYDGRAALACHFLMWPVLLAIGFYYSQMNNTALVFAVVAVIALPVMLANAKRARVLRETAEERYKAIMQVEDEKDDAA